jgi:hypothetical protein
MNRPLGTRQDIAAFANAGGRSLVLGFDEISSPTGVKVAETAGV